MTSFTADRLDLTETPEQETLDLGPMSSEVRSEEGADERTKEALFAKDDLNPASVRESYLHGDDRRVDLSVYPQAAERDRMAKEEYVKSLVASGDAQGASEAIEALSFTQTNPEGIARKEYARKLANTVAGSAWTISEAVQEAPEVADAAVDVMEEFTLKTSIARDVTQQYQKKFQDKSFLGKVGSVGAAMIPFASWAFRNNAIDNAPTVSNLPGNNLKEQIEYLWTLPPVDFEIALREAVAEVSGLSDFDAQLFAVAFLEYSNSDQFWDNAFGVAEAAAIVPVGSLTKGVSAGLKAVKTVKSTAKATMKNGPDVSKVAEALGDAKTAVVERAIRKPSLTSLEVQDDIKGLLASIYDVDKVFDTTKSIGNATARKLQDAATKRAAIATRAAENSQVSEINMLGKAELAKIISDEIESIKKVHTNIKESVVDYKHLAAEDTIDNVDRVAVTFGKQNGELFETEAAAKSWASRYLQFKDRTIKPVTTQTGDRFGIEVLKPLKIDQVLDLKLPMSPETVTPDMNQYLRHFWSDGYKASEELLKDRRTVSDFSEALGAVVEEVGAPIKGLSKNKFERLNEALKDMRAYVNPKTKKHEWDDMAAYEERYYRLYKQFPTEEEIDAYMSARQLSDMSYVFRELSLMRHKMRLGVEKFEIPGVGPMEGIQQKSLPWGSKDFFKVVALDHKGKVLKKGFNSTSGKTKEFFDSLIDEGWTLVQDFGGYANLGDEAATFVLMQGPKRSSLKFGDNVGYNPQHIISKYPYYIKQGTVRTTDGGKKLLTGDKTIWNILSPKQGEKITAHLEEARRLKNSGDDQAFKAYMRDNLPEVSAEDIKRIDWSQRFVVTKSGQTAATSGLKEGVDYTDDLTNNAFNFRSQLNSRFIGEKDEKIVDAIISEQDSLIRVDTADVIDPLGAIQTGLGDAVSSRAFGDYIQKSALRFGQEFGDILDVSNNELRRNPIAFLTDPKFLPGVEKTNPQAVSKARQMQESINNVLNIPTEASTRIAAIKEGILSWAIERYGKDGKITNILDERLLHTSDDPASFFRSVAFHTKMGLFNPKQLFLQSQIATNILSLAGPKDTWAAVAAQAYTHGLRLNAKKKTLEYAAKQVKKFGWKEKEFIESHEALMASGWDIVGSSTAYLDYYKGPELVKQGRKSILDTGLYFFKKGEQFGRITAWHAAYRGWRRVNPGKALDREAISSIRLRASDFTANMTRDMNATWQRGFLSVPTQFWGFQARIFEQMLPFGPSRLSAMEKTKLFAGFSAMYGVPVGLGASAMMVPFDEEIKKYMIEEGLEKSVEGNLFFETVRDGIIAGVTEMVGHLVAGEEFDFDTGPYGPAGNPFLKELFRDRIDWYEVFGGASAGILAEFGGGVSRVMKDSIDLDSPDGIITADKNTIIEILQQSQISSLSKTVKLWKALNTGKWISKNETVLGDITFMEAFIASITGLEPERMSDAFLKIEILQDMSSEIRKGRKEARRHFSLARRAYEDNDGDLARKHLNKARSYGVSHGLKSSDLQRAFREGFVGEDLSESVEERINQDLREFQKRKAM